GKPPATGAPGASDRVLPRADGGRAPHHLRGRPAGSPRERRGAADRPGRRGRPAGPDVPREAPELPHARPRRDPARNPRAPGGTLDALRARKRPAGPLGPLPRVAGAAARRPGAAAAPRRGDEIPSEDGAGDLGADPVPRGNRDP